MSLFIEYWLIVMHKVVISARVETSLKLAFVSLSDSLVLDPQLLSSELYSLILNFEILLFALFLELVPF